MSVNFFVRARQQVKHDGRQGSLADKSFQQMNVHHESLQKYLEADEYFS